MIDADALIEFIENRYEITWDSGTYEGGIKDACTDILEKIDNMETIKPETNCSEFPNGWIPVSKERPPQHQEIWMTSEFGDVELVYGKDGIWLLGDEIYYTEPGIIAWMPANVPEPYQPKEESE
jgi:hypothetical protein